MPGGDSVALRLPDLQLLWRAGPRPTLYYVSDLRYARSPGAGLCRPDLHLRHASPRNARERLQNRVSAGVERFRETLNKTDQECSSADLKTRPVLRIRCITDLRRLRTSVRGFLCVNLRNLWMNMFRYRFIQRFLSNPQI